MGTAPAEEGTAGGGRKLGRRLPGKGSRAGGAGVPSRARAAREGKEEEGEGRKERREKKEKRRRSTHAHGGFSRKRLARGTRKRGTQGRGLNSGVGSADHRKKISENQELGQERILE